jgi:hypothetical protein
MKADPPSALRLKLRLAGYDPLPVNGKMPVIEEWTKKLDANDEEIRLWDTMYYYARSTGVLALRTPGYDIDILNPEAAEAIEALVREYFGEHGVILVRIGLAPKRLIPLRTDEPFKKKLRLFMPPNGTSEDDIQRIEVLADGQQWIANGIHKDTHKPYHWHGGELAMTPRDELPYVRGDDIELLLAEAEHILISDFGYHRVIDDSAKTTARQRRPDSRFGQLNERALANFDKWVPKMFPTATKTKAGGYRVSSADLGRGFEEDLSLDPRGIKFFGIADMGDPRQGRRTPIDLVMEWDHADLLDAVRWLELALDQPAPAEGPPQEPSPSNGNVGSNQSAWDEIRRQREAEEAPPKEPPPTEPPKEPTRKPSRFKLKPFTSITVSTAPNYLVKGILPRAGLVVVWGPPKCCKSFWTFDLVMHIAGLALS